MQAHALWLPFAVSVALAVGATLLWLDRPSGIAGVDDPSLEDRADSLALLAYPLVGALLLRRDNPLGWPLALVGPLDQFEFFGQEYALRGLYVEPGSLPLAKVADLVAESLFVPTLGWKLVLLPLLFPDGAALSRRWRVVAAAVVMALAGAFLSSVVSPGPIDEDRPSVRNPLGLEPAGVVLDAIQIVSFLLLPPLLVAALASLVVRWRRDPEYGRSSVLFGGAVVGLIVVIALDNLLQGRVPGWSLGAPLLTLWLIPLAAWFGGRSAGSQSDARLLVKRPRKSAEPDLGSGPSRRSRGSRVRSAPQAPATTSPEMRIARIETPDNSEKEERSRECPPTTDIWLIVVALAALVTAVPAVQAAGPDDRALYRGTSAALSPERNGPDDRADYRGSSVALAPKSLSPDDRAYARNTTGIEPRTIPSNVAGTSTGFDWDDALIGGTFGLALAFLAVGTVLIGVRHRRSVRTA